MLSALSISGKKLRNERSITGLHPPDFFWRRKLSPCLGHCLVDDWPPCPANVAWLEVTKPQMEQCEGTAIHFVTPRRAWSR